MIAWSLIMPSSKGLFHSVKRLTLNEQFTSSVHTLERQYRVKSVLMEFRIRSQKGHVWATAGQFRWKVLVFGTVIIPVLRTRPENMH